MYSYREKPFEYLRRMDSGELFDHDIVNNWYKARAFVLDRLKGVCFKPDSSEHLHVVIAGDSSHMLFVARQVALCAHYINYQENAEGDDRHRTIITLVSRNAVIKEELEKEEYLCNLPKYCKYVDRDLVTKNSDSYIDIEIHIEEEWLQTKDNQAVVFTEKEVDSFFNSAINDDLVLSIDTRKAVYASRVYELGTIIDNLPAEDIHCAKRYGLALDVFQRSKMKEKMGNLVDKDLWTNQSVVKEKLSNIFCTDCFETRYYAIQQCAKSSHRTEKYMWEKYNEALSMSEHARWLSEKLIMGYSPFSAQQRYHDESLSYDKKKKEQYRKSLKKNMSAPAHIDICSYADLRRINPNDLKLDSFLMLAIPMILEKVYGNHYSLI